MTKPFIKWVGGKSSAITAISEFYPDNIASIKNYCEPFIGGGAMFFHNWRSSLFFLTKHALMAYFGNNFNDEQQKQLKDFAVDISSNNKILISNSDDGSDFFDKLYDGFTINKIKVSRMINSNANLRGKINELLISNYNKFLYN